MNEKEQNFYFPGGHLIRSLVIIFFISLIFFKPPLYHLKMGLYIFLFSLSVYLLTAGVLGGIFHCVYLPKMGLQKDEAVLTASLLPATFLWTALFSYAVFFLMLPVGKDGQPILDSSWIYTLFCVVGVSAFLFGLVASLYLLERVHRHFDSQEQAAAFTQSLINKNFLVSVGLVVIAFTVFVLWSFGTYLAN